MALIQQPEPKNKNKNKTAFNVEVQLQCLLFSYNNTRGKKKCVVAGVCVWRTTEQRGLWLSGWGPWLSGRGSEKGTCDSRPRSNHPARFLVVCGSAAIIKMCSLSKTIKKQTKSKTKVQQHGGTRRRHDKDVVAGPFEAAQFPAGDRNFHSSRCCAKPIN